MRYLLALEIRKSTSQLPKIMGSTEWKRELDRMLNAVEVQSTQSFGIINQRFEQLDIPFDDEFQKHVMKMVKIR